jgi:diadenosine tetraphosphate (Ap4A) HIT family hydrolase
MENTLSEFNTKFRTKKLLIVSNDSWNWSLRPAQATLGTSILSLKRYALHFSDITETEAQDLQKMIKTIESTMKNAFDYNIMNYLMLMMVDHHVHYHVIPRYDNKRECANLSWQDTGWPALPDIIGNQHTDTNCLSKIQEKLKANL